jgi:B12-binding domain/radical SAM domain protein
MPVLLASGFSTWRGCRLSPVVALVLHYRKTARYALNVLLGAVQTHPATRNVPARIAEGPEAVAEACLEALAAGRRPVVAWSFYTASFPEAAAELASVRARAADPGVLHVAGGAHASGDPEGTLRAGFDLAAIGEGEDTLPELLAAVSRGTEPRSVGGLAWLEGGALRRSPRRRPVDLDRVPACAPRAVRLNPMEITRGCAWACRFCQTPFLFRARVRHRSLEAVRCAIRFHVSVNGKEIRFLTPSGLSYGPVGIEPDLDAVEALLAAALEEAGWGRGVFFGTFPSELRPEHVSPRALRIVRRFCDNRRIAVGGQSGSERMLAAMGRGHGVEAVVRAVRYATEAGFTPDVDLVFGLPGEAEEDRAATLAHAESLAALGARIHAHAFMPLPGTPWARAAPGEIDTTTQALLDRLASAGRAHGAWRRQRAVAGHAPVESDRLAASGRK